MSNEVQAALDRMSLDECIKRCNDPQDWFNLDLLTPTRRIALAKEFANRVQANDRSNPFAWLRAYNQFKSMHVIPDGMNYDKQKKEIV